MRSQLEYWKRVVGDASATRGGKLALAVILSFTLLAIFAPWIAPYDPVKIVPESMAADSLVPPSASHLMGTDLLGRDIFSRLVYGTRISLAVGVLAVLFMVLIGAVTGIVSGYYGGWIDSLLMRLTDIFLAFPLILGSLIFLAVLGSNVVTVILVLGALGWPGIARIFRSTILSVKETDYVEAARAAGETNAGVMMRHILPNSVGPVIVLAAIGVGEAILAEAALSFFGIGVQPPTPDWGYMIAESRSYAMTSPWLVLFPGAALALIVAAFIAFGDALNHALDRREGI